MFWTFLWYRQSSYQMIGSLFKSYPILTRHTTIKQWTRKSKQLSCRMQFIHQLNNASTRQLVYDALYMWSLSNLTDGSGVVTVSSSARNSLILLSAAILTLYLHTGLAPALPINIQSFDISYDLASWVLSAYMITARCRPNTLGVIYNESHSIDSQSQHRLFCSCTMKPWHDVK